MERDKVKKGPSMPDELRRSKFLIIRLREWEKRRLFELARRSRKTVSDFIREMIFGKEE